MVRLSVIRVKGFFIGLLITTASIAHQVHAAQSESFPLQMKYTVGIDELMDFVINNSPIFSGHKAGIESARLLHEADKRYYLPKFNLAFEAKNLIGTPNPDPDKTIEAILNVNSKVWGSQQANTNAASFKGLEYEKLSFERKRNEVYYQILRILAKIERVRFYQYEVGILRQEKINLIERLTNSVESGISPVSELKEAELNLVRFDETILNAISIKESLFSELHTLTGVEVLNHEQVGINFGKVNGYIERKINFSEQDIVEYSLEIRVDKISLEQTSLSAEAENERVKLSLISELKSPIASEPELGSGSIRNTSYLGFRMDIQLYDFQSKTLKKSAKATVLRQESELRDKQQRLSAEVLRIKTQYNSLQNQRENAFVQVRIGRELIESQKSEIILDRVTYLDLSKAVMLYNSGFQTLMNLDMQLYDVIFNYLTIKGSEI